MSLEYLGPSQVRVGVGWSDTAVFPSSHHRYHLTDPAKRSGPDGPRPNLTIPEIDNLSSTSPSPTVPTWSIRTPTDGAERFWCPRIDPETQRSTQSETRRCPRDRKPSRDQGSKGTGRDFREKTDRLPSKPRNRQYNRGLRVRKIPSSPLGRNCYWVVPYSVRGFRSTPSESHPCQTTSLGVLILIQTLSTRLYTPRQLYSKPSSSSMSGSLSMKVLVWTSGTRGLRDPKRWFLSDNHRGLGSGGRGPSGRPVRRQYVGPRFP